jgi:hypothetical protein
MRFWLVELPALIVTVWFRIWAAFLTALALVMVALALYSIPALYFGWPVPF